MIVKLRFLLLMTLLCCALSGCGVTVGPRVETQVVILRPGNPVRILENRRMKSQALTGSEEILSQDVGGWVSMPPEHWEAVKRQLEKK
jgi:hypothetical protein